VSNNDFDMQPSLQEETQAARGRTLELILSVVLISAFLGLAINIGSTLLLQRLSNEQVVLLLAGCVLVAGIALATLIPRISTTVREFHNDLEILIPLLVTAHDVEVLRVDYYNSVADIIQPALARRSPKERETIAAAFQKQAQGTGAAEIAAFALEAVQFLLAVKIVQDSRSMLGQDAVFSKLRSVAFAQTAVVVGEWSDLAKHANQNRYMALQTQGVPAKSVLPDGITLTLPHVGPQVPATLKAHNRWKPSAQYVTLLTANSGGDTALRVMALAQTSEYGLPRVTAPHRGRVARAILRNVRDQRIRNLAREEEQAAGQLNDQGQSQQQPEAVAHYTELWSRLYNGSQRPHLLRVFVRLDGSFRIRLLSSERRQRGHYAWGTALSKLLSATDVDTFLAALKQAGQTISGRDA
jgi:hypothetical protein